MNFGGFWKKQPVSVPHSSVAPKWRCPLNSPRSITYIPKYNSEHPRSSRNRTFQCYTWVWHQKTMPIEIPRADYLHPQISAKKSRQVPY